MANRSAAHSWPLSGFSAIRCALMSQQLLPSNQFGPSSGGAMTGRLAGLHGDRRHLLGHRRGKQRWLRLRDARPRPRASGRWESVPPCPARRRATPPRLAPARISLWALGFPMTRVQLPSWSPARFSSVWSPASTVDRCQRHVLVEHVGQLQLVGQVDLAVGGRHRDRRGDDTGQHRRHRPGPASGAADVVVEVGWRRGDFGRRRARTVSAATPRASRRVRHGA